MLTFVIYLSIDLTAASHVHIVEPHWSPMAEDQAVARVYRLGQTQDVTVTRYIVSDTIESYIQWVQRDKLGLIDRSLDSSLTTKVDEEEERWKMLKRFLNA
jgi:SNF2 family DNA or RNA helicase